MCSATTAHELLVGSVEVVVVESHLLDQPSFGGGPARRFGRGPGALDAAGDPCVIGQASLGDPVQVDGLASSTEPSAEPTMIADSRRETQFPAFVRAETGKESVSSDECLPSGSVPS